MSQRDPNIPERSREFEIIVFGATGFTGGLVAEYLAARDGVEVGQWAIAGRDKVKLSQVRAELAKRHPECRELEMIVADSSDPESLRAMSARARVVLTTVGPYAEYGEPLVAACLETKTDYVDLTGEPAWWKEMIARYHDRALLENVLIVPCCGFDSIPHDLGAVMTAKALRKAGARGKLEVDGYVAAKGDFSGGTWASALKAMGEMGPFGKKEGGSFHTGVKPTKPQGIHREDDMNGKWVTPMPTIDPMVANRSASFDPDLGEDFRYSHYMVFRDFKMMATLLGGVGTVAALAQIPPARKLLGRVRKSGEGPDADARARNWFKVTFVGTGDGHRVVGRVSGGDPGYGETSKMIAESALCLARDRAELPQAGGVSTPAAAMGDALQRRLEAAGMVFEVEAG